MSNLPATNQNSVAAMIASKKSKIEQALPAHITPDDFIRSIMVSTAKNPKLMNCAPDSLYLAVIEAANLGLDCSGGVLGQAHLIPYKDKCQLIIGYKGLVDLARRAGEYREFYAMEVRENDNFEYVQGTERAIIHKPNVFEDRGDVIGFYAVAKSLDGATSFEFMSRKEVEGIRDRSQGWSAYKKGWAKESPWETEANGGSFVEMGKKTVIRRLIKLLPLSSQKLKPLVRAAEIDDLDYQQDNQSRRTTLPKVGLPPAISNALKIQTPEPEPEPEKPPEAPSEEEYKDPPPTSGIEAFRLGYSIDANPFDYKADRRSFMAWKSGWEIEAEKLMKEAQEEGAEEGGFFGGEVE